MNKHFEIKFRAKRIDNNEWVNGFYLGNYDPTQEENVIVDHFIYEGLHNVSAPIPVRHETVSQYIGLTDTDGSDIYIGDVMEFEGGDRIIISNENWLEVFADPIGEPECEDQWRDIYRIERAKIIGNVYDKT